jgi:hypothetical protein
MKFFLTMLALLSVIAASGQKIKDIIKTGDLDDLKKYEAKGGDIYGGFEYEYQLEELEETGWTYMYPMAYAVAVQKSDMVDYYITNREKAVEAEWWDEALSQSFIIAISSGDETLIQKIYALAPNLDAVCDPCRGQNAVMVAAAYGLEEWYFKLKPDSNLSLLSIHDNNLLHVAANGPSHRIFEDVLTGGSFNVNALNSFSESALDYAALNGNVDYFHHLVQSGADPSQSPNLWISLAWSGNMEILGYLVENNYVSGIFAIDEEDLHMALHIAMQENHTEFVTRLLDLMLAESVSDFSLVDSGAFWDVDVHPLEWPIDNQNLAMYEAFLNFASVVNSRAEDSTYIPVDKGLTKMANKAFGKEEVAALYEKYGITDF